MPRLLASVEAETRPQALTGTADADAEYTPTANSAITAAQTLVLDGRNIYRRTLAKLPVGRRSRSIARIAASPTVRAEPGDAAWRPLPAPASK